MQVKDFFTTITYKAYGAIRQARVQTREAVQKWQINLTRSRQESKVKMTRQRVRQWGRGGFKAVAPNNGATTDNLARSKWRRASEVLQS